MISKAKAKLIRSLDRKKSRDEHGLFIIEGEKTVLEVLEEGPGSGHGIRDVYAGGAWIAENRSLLEASGINIYEGEDKEIRSLSRQVNPQGVLALARIPHQELDPASLEGETLLAFEAVRDPGNLGTIIRTADWFGFRHILCTPDSVDLYNPKVVQATMGSVVRVRVWYTDLEAFLTESVMKNRRILGTYLEGESIYSAELGEAPVVVFGNEARGITPSLGKILNDRISIPHFASNGKGSESLNLASSVAVFCSELRRRTL
jgi:TrmH family RNA methyltransferase